MGSVSADGLRTRLAERLVRAAAPGDDSQPRSLPITVGLPQHADQHRSQRPVLLAVDQELGEGASRGFAQVLGMSIPSRSDIMPA